MGYCAGATIVGSYASQGLRHPPLAVRALADLSYMGWPAGLLFAVAFAALLVVCTTSFNDSRPNWVVRCTSAPFAAALGSFSYSLYLTHQPLLYLMDEWAVRAQTSPAVLELFRLVIAPVLCVFAARWFYLAFERPFMNTKPRTRVSEGSSPSVAVSEPSLVASVNVEGD